MSRMYDHIVRQCAVEQVDYQRYLLRMTELELLDRERGATDPSHTAGEVPSHQNAGQLRLLCRAFSEQTLVLELARCEFLARRENVLLLGNGGTGKTHVALALGHRVRFITTEALFSELIEARDEKRLLRFQKQIASYVLLIVDEMDFIPLSKTGALNCFRITHGDRYDI